VALDTAWVVQDCARRHAVRIVLSIGLGTLGQLTMLGAVAGAFAYVQAVQTEGPVALRDLGMGPLRIPASLSIDPSSSPATLVALLGGVFVVLLVAALLQWSSKSVGANIVRRYEDDCTRSALNKLSEALSASSHRALANDRTMKRSLLKLLTRDTRYCGRAANEAILAATPALTAAATLAFLLTIGWVPLVVLMGAIILVAPLYVRVNRRGMQSMSRLEILSRRDALIKADVIKKVLESGKGPSEGAAVLDNSNTQRYLNEYETRLKMAHASLFVGNILFAAAICTTLLFFGLFHGRGIGATLVIYLVGLQYLMYSLRTLGKHITNMSVYHTAFGRYVQFIRTGSLAGLELPDTTVSRDDELLDETLQE